MTTLIVSLPIDGATGATEWAYALTPDGQTLGGHGRAPAALLPAVRGAGAEVVAVVPVQALAWHQVELPRGAPAGSPRLRAALEGLLEEKLLDEPERLHFALQPDARPGEPAWVAVCDLAWLRTALQALEAAQRPVDRIVPEFAPEALAALHVVGEAAHPLAVSSGPHGVLAVPLMPSTVGLLPAVEDEAGALAEPAVAAVAEQLLGRRLGLQQAPQRWLRAARTGWDLAQFGLAGGGRARAWRRLGVAFNDLLRAPQWRPARWAAAALVAVQLVGLNAWAWKERASLAAKRQAVQQTLTRNFPHVRVVVDAPVQMEREVAALRQATGAASGRDLESMLAALAATAPAGLAPTSIEFTGNELRLKGPGAAPAAQQAGPGLQAFGYRATGEGDTLVVRQGATP